MKSFKKWDCLSLYEVKLQNRTEYSIQNYAICSKNSQEKTYRFTFFKIVFLLDKGLKMFLEVDHDFFLFHI